MSKEFRDAYVGKETEVLLEEEIELEGKKYFVGYTKEYVKVAVLSEKNKANTLKKGKIAGQLKDELYLMVEF